MNLNSTKLLNLNMLKLTDFQTRVVKECEKKKSGGLALRVGSGKTGIALHLAKKQMNADEQCLIVCGITLIESWKIEIHKFFGDDLNFVVYHPSCIKNIVEFVPDKATRFVITTPEMITKAYQLWNVGGKFIYYEQRPVPGRHLPIQVKMFERVSAPLETVKLNGGFLYSTPWGNLVIDEIQSYINTDSMRCLGLASIYSRNRWALSGTILDEPKIQRLFGYYLIMSFENTPRSLPDFTEYIKNPSFKGVRKTMVFRPDNPQFTPPRIERVVISHTLNEHEMKIYTSLKNTVNEISKQLRVYKQQHNVVLVRKFSAYKLAMITSLRQSLLCFAMPLASMMIDLADLSNENGQNEMLRVFMQNIEKANLQEYLRDPRLMFSSRIKSILPVLEKHATERIILFTSFRTNLDLLNHIISQFRPTFVISAHHSPLQRGQVLIKFQESENGILLSTFAIGSTGLNLQFCKIMLLTDFGWNDGTTQQAIGRIARLGQQSEVVHVYLFTSNTGIEKAVLSKHDDKLTVLKEIETGPMKSKIQTIRVDEIIKLLNEQDNLDLIEKIDQKSKH